MYFIWYINIKYANKNKFEKLLIDIIIFRDMFNTNPITEKELLHNKLSNNELIQLQKLNPNKITNINLLNATHFVWKEKKYRQLIIKTILLKN
jgi:hypothetical protein